MFFLGALGIIIPVLLYFLKKRLSEMESFLQNQPKGIREYDEQMVRRLIEKVLIFETKVSVEFKSGVTSNTII